MNEKKSSGCLVLVVLLVVGLVVLVLIGSGLFWVRGSRVVSRQHAEMEAERARTEQMVFASQSGDEKESVTLSVENFSRYSPADFGSGLTREHFVALMADQNSTELARQAFAKNANGQVVRWLLKTNEVRDAAASGLLVANFELPYRIQTATNCWTGSSLGIRAEFPASERDRLLTIRRNDWVQIEGRLQINPDSKEFKLLDAKIPLPKNVERPEH